MVEAGAPGQLVQRAERQSERAWNEDGLPELFLGAFALLGALGMALRVAVWWVPITFLVLPPLVVRWLGKGMVGVKERVSDPRIGYVRPRTWRRSRCWLVVFMLVGGVLGAARGALEDRVVAAVPSLQSWGPVVWLVPGVVAMFVGGYRLGLVRYFVVGAVSLLGLVAGPLAGLGGWDSVALAIGVQGAALLVSGASALLSFVRRVPPPRAE